MTTRKHFPGTKRLSLLAVEAGGGLVHRTGLSESILIFDQHRVFSPDFAERLKTLRRLDPERKVAVGVADVEEGVRAADLGADILQCDKMSPEDVGSLVARAKASHSGLIVSAAGGVTVRPVSAERSRKYRGFSSPRSSPNTGTAERSALV